MLLLTCTTYNEQKLQAVQGEQPAMKPQMVLIQKLVQEQIWS